VFENRVLRRIRVFGPKRNEVTGGWRQLPNAELHKLYSSPSIIGMIKSRMRWAGNVVRTGQNMNAYRILVGRPEGKRPRRRWVDNIKMDLREIGWAGMDWTDLAQDRDQWRALVNTVMNFRFPYNFGKFLSSCVTGCLSRRAQLHGVNIIITFLCQSPVNKLGQYLTPLSANMYHMLL
jgi:hypothetical protein